MKIKLQRAITSLTSALDFVGVDEVHHAKRVALMAAGIAAEMGWDRTSIRDIMYLGMLHDCGVSRVREHRQIGETLEWEGADDHCRRGEQYLLACPPLARFAGPLRWHHTRWETLSAQALDPHLRQSANLIFLADRIDVLMAPYVVGESLQNEILWEYPKIVGRISSLKNTLFCPGLIAAFGRAAVRESFWLCMDPAYIEDEIEERLHGTDDTELTTAEALAIAGLFARTVDAKSSYTLEHSTRVARIARHLAAVCGIKGEQLDQIEIAGLLHDIGKLRVPEEIIDKPGALTGQERAFVMRHSYDTGRILKKVFPGQPIADWAGMHHENLLGTGYPEHQSASDIPREARLIAVADIFQALSQHRPYRKTLGSGEVMAHMDELLRLGRVDREMIELLRNNLSTCYELAVN
jgi:putative nucleotidyltransferase with HDIG domain